MWTRYLKQRKLDKFVHFFKCVSEVSPPSLKQTLSIGQMQHSAIEPKKSSDSKKDLYVANFYQSFPLVELESATCAQVYVNYFVS